MYDEMIKIHESLDWMENTVSKRGPGETSLIVLLWKKVLSSGV